MQKFEYLGDEKSCLDEVKCIFHSFLRAIIWWKKRKVAETSFKKVFSLKNSCLNKSHWLCTLQIHMICKSLVEIGHKFMEISLNHIDCIDVCDKEMLTVQRH